jgi:mannose-6-phosphate isomerase
LNKRFLKKNIFPRAKSVGKRLWGKEDLLVLISKKLTLKRLVINKNRRGGLQYHHKKNECGYILKGKLKVNYDLGDGNLKSKILKKGDVFYFPNGLVHQEIALTKCEIIEASTPHFNDRVRVESKYNIKSSKGLPTTKKNNVRLL